MVMPSTSELARLRADMEAGLMPDECNILEVTQTSDSQGGFTDTWGTVTGGAEITCRIDSQKGMFSGENVKGGALQPYHTFVLTLPQGTTITESNRVEVNSGTFTVTSVDTSKSWNACVRAWLEIV